jgi:hypothetical protein
MTRAQMSANDRGGGVFIFDDTFGNGIKNGVFKFSKFGFGGLKIGSGDIAFDVFVSAFKDFKQNFSFSFDAHFKHFVSKIVDKNFEIIFRVNLNVGQIIFNFCTQNKISPCKIFFDLVE